MIIVMMMNAEKIGSLMYTLYPIHSVMSRIFQLSQHYILWQHSTLDTSQLHLMSHGLGAN